MKYHINDNHEVKPCEAEIKACQYRTASPGGGHYSSHAEAEAEAQRRLQEEYSLIPSVTRVRKHRKVAHMFRDLSQAGVKIRAEGPLTVKASPRDTSSVTILRGNASSDSKIVSELREGKLKAFAS